MQGCWGRCIDFDINAKILLSYSLFQYIQIVFPSQSNNNYNIDSFIIKYNQKFVNNGWKLSKAPFKYDAFNLELKNDNYDNSLMIKRI